RHTRLPRSGDDERLSGLRCQRPILVLRLALGVPLRAAAFLDGWGRPALPRDPRPGVAAARRPPRARVRAGRPASFDGGAAARARSQTATRPTAARDRARGRHRPGSACLAELPPRGPIHLQLLASAGRRKPRTLTSSRLRRSWIRLSTSPSEAPVIAPSF